jgi:hypothetical protein
MGRIFIGLVKCGAWGCFDEFNRLEEAVLSAVSMQIQTIQAAVKRRESHTELLGRQVGCKKFLQTIRIERMGGSTLGVQGGYLPHLFVLAPPREVQHHPKKSA